MGISYPFPLLYGPLFFIYTKLVSKKENRVLASDLLHFIPFVTVYLLCIPIYLSSGEQKIEFLDNMLRGVHPPMFSVFECIFPFQGLLYTFLIVRTVREYNIEIRKVFSNIDVINLNWLKYITFGMILVWSIVALLYLVPSLITTGYDRSIQISVSILIYAIGYKALKQPEIFMQPLINTSGPAQSEKYRRSGLTDKLADEIGKKLREFMASEKPYLDNDLTMQKLADCMNVSCHNLSEVINTKLNLSYYDFINNYRVEEFKNRISDPANDHYNILSIAYDSGFKSKGTFNSIFKKNIGTTPSEYKSKVRSTP
jgi:AraC-like DNA-binding protein